MLAFKHHPVGALVEARTLNQQVRRILAKRRSLSGLMTAPAKSLDSLGAAARTKERQLVSRETSPVNGLTEPRAITLS